MMPMISPSRIRMNWLKFSSVSTKPNQPSTRRTVSFSSIPSLSMTACTRGRMAEIPMVSSRPPIRIMTPRPITALFWELLRIWSNFLIFSIMAIPLPGS